MQVLSSSNIISILNSPNFATPKEFINSHHYDLINVVYYPHQGINLFNILAISKLYSFTLSHFGSNVPLPTLTPDITTSEPRLGTGCWLGFTRWDSHPLYDISLNPPKQTKDNTFVLSLCYVLVMKICSLSLANFYLTYSEMREPRKLKLSLG